MTIRDWGIRDWGRFAGLTLALACSGAEAQTPPSAGEAAAYEGLHAAVYRGDHEALAALIAGGADLEARDGFGRTGAHVAAYRSDERALEMLAEAGANLNAFERQRYDIVTIAAVADDPDFLARALALGASPGNTTSPYDGTALIAAAHLGHTEVVRILIEAGAPLDHINNIQWTAVIEAIVLGDGGPDHQATLKALLDAGADPNIPDGGGVRPLEMARARGFREMIAILIAAGAR
ncbi:MAG: ankyrin repeat domain-containing protein [Paracoccaceae bacterium]|nr:ankyrin repeat domain-containing protein [Paracoccaceae bacterium]